MNKLNYKRNLAFTLAEILLTLGIIGVVAALTIPALMSNIQDYQFQQAWKKEYSTITQAINQVYADEGVSWNKVNYPNTTVNDSYKYFCKLTNRLKVAKSSMDCTDEDNPTYDGLKYSWNVTGKYKTKNNLAAIYNGAFNANTAILADGSSIRFDSMNNFWIDVNGQSPPNVIGRDIFYFLLSQDTSDMGAGSYFNLINQDKNIISFWGMVNAYNCPSTSCVQITQANYLQDCESGTGWGCSAKIILGD